MKRFAALLIVCAMVLCLLSVSVMAGTSVDSPEPQPTPSEQEVPSPQTGMNGSLAVAGIVMIAALGAATVAVKKV